MSLTATTTTAPATTTYTQTSSTQANDRVQRGDVVATFNYFTPPKDGSKAYGYVEPQPAGVAQNNYGVESRAANVVDIRGHESEYSLGETAFGTVQGLPETGTNWDDDDSVEKTYYPQVEKLLLNKLGIQDKGRVLIFDHTIRKGAPNAKRAPVQRAHIDQTAKSATDRVSRHMGEDAERLKRGRFWLVNVWRPLNGPVESSPLAVADARTVKDGVVVPVEHRYPTWTGETAGIAFNPDMVWHYWSGMKNDERLLLQCFDSHNPQTRVPHSAFVDPRSPADAKTRESIEVRALVFEEA